MIDNDRTEYGIEDIWTVGGINTGLLPKLATYIGGADKAGVGFAENVVFTTNDGRVVISPDGTIALTAASGGAPVVDVQAVFSFKGVSITSTVMKLRCVFDGVNVYNYNELYNETVQANPRPVVLQKSIKEDFSATNHVKITSTYDLTYYENIGAPESSKKINVLMQFKNNVYGNGYEINAHNATLGMLDSTGVPKNESLFKGPLNFVSVAQGGVSVVSVKGQDNIVFGVYDNVTLNNVILKSCDLTPTEDGKVDLNELTYAGTTVEVLGDNVTIEYSRLMNGRTVLRVFGDEKDANKEINVLVKNTMIKGSRDFSARIGSNRFYSSTEASPNLPGDTGSDYNTKKNYNGLSDAKKEAYDDKYINTFVTFQNVVFEDAGIFAIGLDSHFAGSFLHDASTSKYASFLTGWYGLAKTSYGAKITLQDDVRLYSWKPLDDINSDTLIENILGKDDALSKITFDVKALVNGYKDKQNVLYKYDGKDYVHAGIAFFGGGKNYSVVETNITSGFNHTLSTLQVTLKEVDQAFLENAAGTQPFYFMVYGANSTFNYLTQLEMTDKYSCLYN